MGNGGDLLLYRIMNSVLQRRLMIKGISVKLCFKDFLRNLVTMSWGSLIVLCAGKKWWRVEKVIY